MHSCELARFGRSLHGAWLRGLRLQHSGMKVYIVLGDVGVRAEGLADLG